MFWKRQTLGRRSKKGEIPGKKNVRKLSPTTVVLKQIFPETSKLAIGREKKD